MYEIWDIIGDVLWGLRHGCWDLLYVVETITMLFSDVSFMKTELCIFEKMMTWYLKLIRINDLFAWFVTFGVYGCHNILEHRSLLQLYLSKVKSLDCVLEKVVIQSYYSEIPWKGKGIGLLLGSINRFVFAFSLWLFIFVLYISGCF